MSDYISREADIEAIREEFGCETCNGGRDGTICTFCDVGEAILLIKKIPAADVEPVRRGKWNIRVSDERTLCLECSVCGRRVDNFNLHRLLIFREYELACGKYPYCHCGAKMDLEGENNENFSK